MIRQRHYTPVATSYARALLGTGRRLGTLVELAGEARQLADVVVRTPRLMFFFDNPGVSTRAKHDLLEKSFGGRLSDPLMRMLRLLVDRERTRYLAEILDLFGDLAEREQGIHQGVVQTARPLPDEDRERLQKALEAYTGHRLNIDFRVDDDLIGGLLFRSGDLLVDGTLRHGLVEIREKLLHTQVLSA